MVVAGIVGYDGWLAGCFFFFPSPTCGFVWSVEWRWVVLFRSVGGCLGLLGCEIWRPKFLFIGFEFNYLGFKFARFVYLFKYIMCSYLIYLFYLGLSRMLA